MKMLLKVVLATIAIFGLSLNAQADWKMTNGAGCQSHFGYQENLTNKQTNGIRNISKKYVWVSCDLPRDNRLGGFRLVSVYANVSKKTRCYSYSKTSNGGTASYNFGFNLGWIPLPLKKHGAFGSYVLLCLLPPNGRLNTTVVNETGNTTVL